MKKLLPAVVFLLLISSTPTAAQDAKTFLDRVREHIKLKFPNWQFGGEGTHGSVRHYTLKVEKQPLQLEVVYTETEKAAAWEFRNHQYGFPVSPKWKAIDIGDEAVYFQSNHGETCFLTFRRYNVAVQMYAPSFAVAVALAREIDSIFFISYPANALSQDAQALLRKVEDHFKNRHPDWEPYRKQITGANTEYTLLNGKDMLQCLVAYTDSEQAAKSEYKNQIWNYPVIPTAQVKDLADEAVLYKVENSEENSIIFRKSKVVVLIQGSTLAICEGLAREIAGLIP
jgi:hypothetical protein